MPTALPASRSGKPALDVARQVALEAGALLRQRFNSELRIAKKGRANIVTDVDYAVEQLVTERLRAEFPACAILAEESGKGGASKAEHTWIVDPLDGTRNYSIGVPYYAVTMALAQGDTVLLGVTYDPSREELFWAQRGQGAFAGDRPMRISTATALDQAVLGTDLGYSDALASYALELARTLWPGMQALRIMGSAALGLAYAASGRIDLYFHHQLAPWDLAAGVLLAQEAGGVVTDRNGRPLKLDSPNIIVSNRALHAEFLRRTEGLPWRTAKG